MRCLLLALALVPCTGAKLVDVRSARHADFTRIVFETDEKVSYAIENLSQGSERAIELSLPAAATETIIRAVHKPAISVEVESRGGGSRALVRVSEPVDVWTNHLENPPRVVLDLKVAEAVGARDPEVLDALDYQIVVEANPQGEPDAEAEAAPTARTPERATTGREPPRAPSPSWARSPWMWWALGAIALVFLIVLYLQRLSQRRRRQQRALAANRRPRASGEKRAPVRPRREEALGVAKDALPTDSESASPRAQAAVRPTAASPPGEPKAPLTPEPPKPKRPEDDVEEPLLTTELEEPEPPRAETSDRELFALVAQMEERMAVLERDLRATRAEGRELREQSDAQAEELRAHRAAMTRLLRRGGRRSGAAEPAPRPPTPSSS